MSTGISYEFTEHMNNIIARVIDFMAVLSMNEIVMNVC